MTTAFNFGSVKKDIDIEHLIKEQLATGKYRDMGDAAPSDWVVRAWQALPTKEAGWVATAVHQCLSHSSPEIRAEALRTLDMCPQMADPAVLLNLAESQFDLFRGLRRGDDSPNTDRGRDFVQLTASVAHGAQGEVFRRQMAQDPVYGMHVLAALVQNDADWVVTHAHELITPELDPEDTHLNIIFFNLRKDPQRLQLLVRNLAKAQPGLHGRLQDTIRMNVRDPQLQNDLLGMI